MTVTNQIGSLKKLLNKASKITREDSSDPDFKVWKNLVERTLIKVFGSESFELDEFRKLKFFYNPMISYLGEDYSSEHLRCFRRDFEIAKKQIALYIEEFEEAPQIVESKHTEQSGVNKVFISHSTKDKDYVEELIDILETIGVKSTQIFCSSFEGYGIDLGENFLERIKNELNEEVLVLFVLSENFYSSPVCLCEMGATWIKTSEHIPILIPPFDFENIKGVIPLTQGFKINDSLKLNLFKEKLEKVFDINPIDFTSWERKRDRIIKRIVIPQ